MHLRLHLALLASCVSCVSCASAWRRAALDTWRFASLDGGVALANVSTPGSTHTHLLDGGVLPQDPYFRFNELDLRWVAQATWVYETPLPPLETDAGAARVTFEALDGVAHVSLNGQALGPAAVNAFRPHTFTLPTKQLRRDGSDSLRVVFTPPLEYMTSAAAAYPYEIPATRNFNVWAEPTHRPFLRKAGSDFGWDWGPAFATSGITGPVVVEWLSPSDEPADHGEVAIAQLSNLHVEYEFPARDDWSVVCGNVTVDVESVSEPSQLKVRLFLDGKQHGDDIALGDAVSSDELAQFAEATLKFEIPNPILWWPAGYGEAHLYDVRVEVLKSDSIVSVVSHHVGFRTVELVQDKTNDGGITGATFFFRINGVPIFIKGANWIPNDSFPTRVTPEKVNYLLKSALAANMNMIRVWGGGRYESDHFYETCDRLGLLVWHEFMFACAMYPRNSAFLEEVTQEVLYQTKRLRKYTSIAIWGGNNENENMMESFANGDFMPAGKTFNRDVAVVDFTVIFVDIVRPIVLALDKSRPFVDTSPSNGLLSEHPYVKRWGKSTNEVAYGDVHYYNYSGDCQDPVMYPHARFISEFGFQSVPSIYALRDISNDSDWTSFQSLWKLLKFRERHENGTLQMTAQLARRFHVPFPFLNENWLNTPLEGKFDIDIQKRVSAYAYLTQIQQGLCYQTAIETWRRGRNEALGGTMGILYWQLNDVWQGTSWSSMEYNGRWKSLQFAVQRAYSPVLVTVHSESDMISIYGINDHMDEDVALTLTYELVATGTGRVIYSQASSKTRVPRLSSEPLDHLSVSSLLKSSATCHKTSCFLRVRCTAEARCEDAFYFFSPFKVLRLCHGRVVIDRVTSVSSQSEVAFDVSVRSENFVALFVELESPQILGLWTKNSIHLVGNETQTFRFTAANASVALSADAFQQQLEVRWLQQIYESQAEVMIQ